MNNVEVLQRYQQRKGALWTERSSWDSQYRELGENFLPRAGRFDASDHNDGKKRFTRNYDSTPIRAARILPAGLMAGSMSPARPWFALSIPDKDLLEFQPVKLWLHKLTEQMRGVFSRSNTYRATHSVFEELGVFGTGVSIASDDYQTLVHHTPLTAGRYALATDDRGMVSTIYREEVMTVEQVVRKFGYKRCSMSVRNAYDRGNYDHRIDIVHVIEPRKDRDTTKRDARNMPFKSIYFEASRSSDATNFLRESGFKRFPALAPRFTVTATDVYGFSPGMEALGDAIQLQHEQLRKAEGIDYKTRPPLQVPSSLKHHQVNRLPGGVTFVDTTGPHAAVRTAFEVNLDLSHLLEDIRDVRERINQSFYVDLFMMLANDTRSNITAREVAERHEEKLLMLGPVLERLHNEMLSPLIDLTFDKMIGATLPGGRPLVPPPPKELQGMELQVEFVSTLAQAQRAVGTSAIDRYVMTLGQVASMKPEILDKLDADQLADAYADMLGVDPQLVVADDKVALIRQQRAKQQQAAQMMQAAPIAADTAKTLGDTDMQGIMNMFQGYSGGVQ